MLAAWAFVRIGPARLVPSVVVAAVALVAATPLVDLRTPLAPERVAKLPILGTVTITQGRGTIQWDVANVGYGAEHAVQPIDDATSRAWVNLSIKTAAILTQYASANAIVAYAFRNALFNVNTVNLQHLLRAGSAFSARMIDPIVTGDSVDGYLAWLRGDAAEACVLLTSDRLGGDFPPAINRAHMEEAALLADFVRVEQWPAPDGQNIVLWKRSVPLEICK
jgi:hypothetical protein